MQDEYKVTIGMEIHAELNTHTKMFCDSKNDPDEQRPNVNVCPVCLAHPGTLPAINKEAVRHVLRVGAALGGTLADYSEFDRKNYFYPDLPKGYQISQFEFPLVSGGELAGVSVTRVHLEEDTASSVHDDASGTTLIDFNRAGVPLMELVTDPVITSAEMASSFARELQLLLRYLGASRANMEKGEMRVEANISVSKDGTLGTKVEVKNLNSFNAMERAVAYEIQRQSALLDKGGKVVQETRGWDDAKQATFPQRIKEGSADYRYFPDPDLPSLKLSELSDFAAEAIRAALPETPSERKARYLQLGLKAADAEAFRRDVPLGAFFESAIASYPADTARVALAANYIANDLVRLRASSARTFEVNRDAASRDTELQEKMPISVVQFNGVIELLSTKKISSRGAKDLLAALAGTEHEATALADSLGLFQKSSHEELLPVVEKLLQDNQGVVADYKAGKAAALQFLVGRAMKALKGSGNPEALRKIILQKIG